MVQRKVTWPVYLTQEHLSGCSFQRWVYGVHDRRSLPVTTGVPSFDGALQTVTQREDPLHVAKRMSSVLAAHIYLRADKGSTAFTKGSSA